MGLTGEHLLTETATVTDPIPTGERDAYGVVLTAPVTRTAPFWHYQIATDEADPVAGETHWGFLPPGDPVTSRSTITVGGVSFEVVGPPGKATNPRTGGADLVKVTLRRTSG